MFPCLEETFPDERRGKQGKGERHHQPCVAIIRDDGEANGNHVVVALPFIHNSFGNWTVS
jgi:hypothetical protein